MKRNTLALGLSALLLALGSQAMAQSTPQSEVATATPPSHSAKHKHPGKRHAEHQAKRQLALKEKLKLRADQQTAWDQYQQTMQRPQRTDQQPTHDKPGELSTPQRIAQMQAHQAKRQQAMDRRLQALQAFYEQLDPEQKTTFDRETQRRHGNKHGQRMRLDRSAPQEG